MKKEIRVTIIGELLEINSLKADLLKRADENSSPNFGVLLHNAQYKLSGDTDNLYFQVWYCYYQLADEVIKVLQEISQLHPDVVIYATSVNTPNGIIYATGGEIVYSIKGGEV